MPRHSPSVSTYLSALPDERRMALQTLHTIILRIAPDINESIAYGMPSYEGLCSIASQKNYISLYLNDFDLLEKYRPILGKVDCGKCCIRFKKISLLNLSAVESMLREIHARKHPPE